MNYLVETKYSFESKATVAGAFGVVRFSGTEGLSELYQFDIDLVSDSAEIDLDKIMQEPATFYIHRPDESKVPFHGVIEQCDLIRAVGEFFLYRVLLVPKFWRLTLTHHNQIFLNSPPRDIIEQVLKDGGLSSTDYEFRLQSDYVTWEYACQYGESHYDFICRWMERNGMYFFFEQSGGSEKLIITDSKLSHVVSDFGTDLTYSPPSGLESLHLDEAVQAFLCRRRQVPKSVTLQDYNYRKPTLDVKGKADILSTGYGELYYYGEHFRTPEEGHKLAKIRAEAQLCKEKRFYGESTAPYLMPGYKFKLQNHFNKKMNAEYLTISITHYGNQSSSLITGIRENLPEIVSESSYRNSLTAIAGETQFREECVTEGPRLPGTLNGRIDAAGSGKYAEVDGQGRYKVILPFDLSGRKGGKASAWVRMMQPYTGSDHGMHFPLHKDCEVLLTFIEGDPDRPIIAGAVSNPEHPSQITNENQTMSKLTTSGGNKMHIQDQEGSESIVFVTPGAGTHVRMGEPAESEESEESEDEKYEEFEHNLHKANEEESGYKIESKGSYVLKTGKGKMEFIGGLKQEMVFGNEFKFLGGAEESITVGLANKVMLGNEFSLTLLGAETLHFPHSWVFCPATNHLKAEMTEMIGEKTSAVISETKAIGAVTKAIGETTEAIGETTKAIGAETKAIGEMTKAIGAEAKAIGETTKAIGATTKAVGEETKTIGAVTKAIGEETKAIGAETKTIGEQTTLIGEKTETAGAFAVMAGMVTLM